MILETLQTFYIHKHWKRTIGALLNDFYYKESKVESAYKCLLMHLGL